jgi:hypothetical protein
MGAQDRAIALVLDWASAHATIRALAIVGSHARGEAGPDSDIDLMILADDPAAFRHSDWLASIAWRQGGLSISRWRDEEYGAVWSRRIWLQPGAEVELSFGHVSWADLDPIDAGTRRVISDGCRILYDPDGALHRLSASIRDMNIQSR